MEINSLRLLIIADDPQARAGLGALLEAHLDFVVAGNVAADANMLAG